MLNIDKKELTERFMRYVQIDTQSDPNSNAHPTTEKQKDYRLIGSIQLSIPQKMHFEFGNLSNSRVRNRKLLRGKHKKSSMP